MLPPGGASNSYARQPNRSLYTAQLPLAHPPRPAPQPSPLSQVTIPIVKEHSVQSRHTSVVPSQARARLADTCDTLSYIFSTKDTGHRGGADKPLSHIGLHRLHDRGQIVDEPDRVQIAQPSHTEPPVEASVASKANSTIPRKVGRPPGKRMTGTSGKAQGKTMPVSMSCLIALPRLTNTITRTVSLTQTRTISIRICSTGPLS